MFSIKMRELKCFKPELELTKRSFQRGHFILEEIAERSYFLLRRDLVRSCSSKWRPTMILVSFCVLYIMQQKGFGHTVISVRLGLYIC